MIVGLGLGHRARLARENFRFARQAGATHIVATYLNSSPANAPGTEEPFLSPDPGPICRAARH